MAIAIQHELEGQARRPVAAAWPLEKLIFWALPFLVVFVNSADFRGDTGEQFTVHWQIYLRLMVSLLCGAFGAAVLFPKTYRDFITWPGMLLLIEVTLYGLSQITSVQSSYTFAAWICYIGVLLMIPAAIRSLGRTDFLYSILWALICYLIGSWIAYIVFPEIGVHKEYTIGTAYVERMGGLGHPNELGMLAAYATLLAAGMTKTGRCSRMFGAAVILLGAATLYTCFSRTSTICTLLGLAIVFRQDIHRIGNLSFLGLIAGAGSLLLYFAIGFGYLDLFLQDLVGKVTKSGSVEELSTATGRTEIWSEAARLIYESPITGYGYAGARFVMEDHSYHAHNIILNGAIYAGVLGAAVVAVMMLVILRGVLRKPDAVVDGLAVCMLFGGMLEGLLGAASPGASVLIWTTLLLWRQMPSESKITGNTATSSALPSLARNEKLA